MNQPAANRQPAQYTDIYALVTVTVKTPSGHPVKIAKRTYRLDDAHYISNMIDVFYGDGSKLLNLNNMLRIGKPYEETRRSALYHDGNVRHLRVEASKEDTYPRLVNTYPAKEGA